MDARQYRPQAHLASPIARRALRFATAGLVAATLAVALAGCGSDKWGFPYRASVQQGNWITQDQIAQLQQGMTRDQVRFVLGSPTLTDPLHANRWDYPYRFKPGHGEAQQRLFTVWFENDALARWAGDEQPQLQPFQLDRAKADEAVDRALDSVSEEAKASPNSKDSGAKSGN